MYVSSEDLVIMTLYQCSCPVKFVLHPVFSVEAVSMIDCSSKLSVALDGTKYLPGIVGLNNIKVQ